MGRRNPKPGLFFAALACFRGCLLGVIASSRLRVAILRKSLISKIGEKARTKLDSETTEVNCTNLH
jgi:hypothetical protein